MASTPSTAEATPPDGELAELENSRSLLEATLESVAEGVLVIGTDGKIKCYNQKLLAMWGLTEAQMTEPRSAVPCMSGQLKDPAAFIARVRELYAEPEAVATDLLELKDGRYFERYSQPQRMGDKVVGRLWSYRDVTERIRAVEDVKQAGRYKDEFLSVISHELRTPLNFITGFASILEDGLAGALNPQQHLYLNKISNGADRMLHLVNNLLDFTRLAAGNLSINPEWIPFAPLLNGVLGPLRPLADEKEILLLTDGSPSEPIFADGARIAQALTNLIDNAIKFTPAKGRVTVRSGVEAGMLVVAVDDTGIGIAPQDLPRLFERFRQLDMGSTRRVGGAGLGLAISKSLIEAHGGTIGVESTPGEGSTFWFRVPLASPET